MWSFEAGFGSPDLPKISSLVAAVISLNLLYLASKAFYNAYLHPLSRFPGPKHFAASHIPISIEITKGNYSHIIKELHDTYGPVVRVAPNELAFSHPDALRDLAARPSLPKSPEFYVTVPGEVPSILTVMNEADHSRYRRLLSHAFSEKALREQEPLITKYIDLLISRLHDNVNTTQDIVAWFNYVSFDIIGDLTLGESFQCLEHVELHPWVAILFDNFKSSAIIAVTRRFPLLKAAWKYFVPKSLVEVRRKHIGFTREKVLKRITEGTDRPDFMSNVLKHNDRETGMSEAEIVPTFAILLLAGSETTATLLSVATFFLLKNPRVLSKLIDEVRTSFTNEDEITIVGVNKLKYELAVLDEALRIHSPVAVGNMRQVPQGGATINGHWVAGGTNVSAHLYSMTRSASNWTDPELFVPERWLGDPRYASDNRAALTPFSVGPRNCIGRNLAYAEMRVILARLLWNFDLELDDRSKSWSDMKSFFLWEKPPLYVKLTPVVLKP